MKIISVVAARPNFMKIAPFIRALEKHNHINKNIFEHILVHTGQHYDIPCLKHSLRLWEYPIPILTLK